ncbi:MAG: dimethylaniline monooxygenase (N-oxide forming) [Gammaproteobacteria bacterium]
MQQQPILAPLPQDITKRIAILGAGAAGLCAAKYLLQAGFENVSIFEMGTQIGGMWCYENDNKQSSAYRTLHINTSRKVTQFSDLPFDPDVQFFPDHWDMHRYLLRYAQHFKLTERIRMQSEVVDIRPVTGAHASPQWELVFRIGEKEVFDTVVAATGHLSVPNHVAKFRDQFEGEYLHSHYYRTPQPYVGQRICIVGVGNSALDISGDVCATAPRCVLVARSGALIMPKLICGIPGTEITQMIQRPWLPAWLRRRLLRMLAFLAHGDQTKLGFRPLKERVHATSNGTIITDVAYKRVEVKHEIDKIEGKKIFFNDGTSDEFDVLIAATGYLIDLPFISCDIVSLSDNKLNLYKRIVQPGWPGLYFMGFFNTDTALNMVFERQAQWICDLELGKARLPSEAQMHADIVRKENWVKKYYKHSDRHTIEEEHVSYLRELKRSLRAMRRAA